MSLGSVNERIEAAKARRLTAEREVTLVAVTKGRTVADIVRLYDLGHRDFGENRAQELAEKAPDCPADIRWHFIGPLQTNKARVVRGQASLLHSMDRVDLAKAWMKGPGSSPPALLQVNIGEEPQKSGVTPEAVAEECQRMLALGVRLRGFMAIPPMATDPEKVRPYFAALWRIGSDLQAIDPDMSELSMGMSDDFEVAIEEGATIIRVGRAIFGD